MSLADSLSIEDDVVDDGDRLGGDGYVWQSGVFPVVIDLAYLSESSSEAVGLNMVYKDENGRELKNTLWIKSGKNSKNPKKTYYVKEGVKHNLPGMNHANAIALLTLGKQLTDLTVTEKTVALWDYDAKAEVNTKVEVYMDLIDQRIDVGVLRQIVDKNELNETTGKWEATGEVRDINEVDKFFRESDGLTVTEIQAGETVPTFKEKWETKWTGVTQNKATAVKASGATGGSPATAPTTTKKLFK